MRRFANSLTKKAPYKETAYGARDWCGWDYGDLGAAGGPGAGARTDAASCVTVTRSMNERWAASNVVKCRPIGGDR